MTTTRGTVIYGKELEVGDDLEFLGKSHIITHFTAYEGDVLYSGAKPQMFHDAEARIAHAAPNWGMTIDPMTQFFLCPEHNWWTVTGCYKHGTGA